MVHPAHERRLCRLDDIPDGGILACDGVAALGGADVMVLRRGDEVAAYYNVCPHAGRRLDWAPGEFLLRDGVLVCAAHGASYDASSGACRGGPCRGDSLRAIAVHVQADEVLLDELVMQPS